jgi:hypothetical protein
MYSCVSGPKGVSGDLNRLPREDGQGYKGLSVPTNYNIFVFQFHELRHISAAKFMLVRSKDKSLPSRGILALIFYLRVCNAAQVK